MAQCNTSWDSCPLFLDYLTSEVVEDSLIHQNLLLKLDARDQFPNHILLWFRKQTVSSMLHIDLFCTPSDHILSVFFLFAKLFPLHARKMNLRQFLCFVV